MGFEGMSKEQKEQAAACKSVEEIATLAKEEGCELSEQVLEGIAGGIDMPELPDERIDCHGFFIS